MLGTKHGGAHDGYSGQVPRRHDIHGARVIARAVQLTAGCISDNEIDGHIQMLKEDLDAGAKEMKRLVAINQRGALFEGWSVDA